MFSQRNRAWRRSLKRRKRKYTRNIMDKREKNWKLLYLRSEKLARAKQLGFSYPRVYMHQLHVDGSDE